MNKSMQILIGAFLYLNCISTSVAKDKPAPLFNVPGTGVRAIFPAGIKPAPLGPYFTDAAGTKIILLIAAPMKHSLESDPAYRAIFPDPPEIIQSPKIAGRLYRRTRIEHGGGWDGWWFVSTRGDITLTVQAMYTGNYREEVEELKELFSTISWDENQIDQELAFGATTSVPNLRLVQDGFGGLFFTENGERSTKDKHLLIQAMAYAPGQGKMVIPAACPALKTGFNDKPYVGPYTIKQNGITLCDAWSIEEKTARRYAAMLLFPNGQVVSANGLGDPTQFRSSLLNIRSNRKR